MGTIQVVTGYVPIQSHPRVASEYGALGEKMFGPLAQKGVMVTPFYETLGECWMWRACQMVKKLSHSVGDNPAKNTLAYHCVQHQKFAWLLKAAIKFPMADTLVWMDYGIAHVPGVTPEVVSNFLDRIQPDDFAIPGCWRREQMILNDFFPCWRFCGGVIVLPRNRVHKVYKTIKRTVLNHIQRTGNVTWEVNTLAEAEPQLPVRWYQADHNETMFTGY